MALVLTRTSLPLSRDIRLFDEEAHDGQKDVIQVQVARYSRLHFEPWPSSS